MSKRTRLLRSPGLIVSFTRLLEKETTRAIDPVLQAIETLAPAVHPLALDLEVGCCFPGSLVFDDNVSPRDRDAHIRESVAPPRMELKPSYVGYEHISVIASLTLDVIREWCHRAVNQEPPDAVHPVAFRQLWCVYARARFFPDSDRDDLVLEAGGTSWPVPILKRDGSLWAPGPLPDLPMDAPISFVIKNTDGLLSTDVQIGWELWSQSGYPECELLRRSINKMLLLGWQTDSRFLSA